MRPLKKEALRYLGYGSNAASDSVNAMIDECERELSALPTVRYIYRIFDGVSVSDDVVTLGGVEFKSRGLSEHLSGCDRAAVLCATLGSAADMQRLRLERFDMSRAVVMDAVQSAYIEKVCDDACAEILSRVQSEGLYLTSRFSPGYGDMALSYQSVILRMMDAQKRIGLTCSDSFMLTPQKSVTAIAGITADADRCGGDVKCARCPAREMCRFARA